MADLPSIMTETSLEAFLQREAAAGKQANTLRRYRNATRSLLESLPSDKLLTKERLQAWRDGLTASGLSAATVQNYVKYVNRYLDHAGYGRLRFNRGNAKDLSSMTFGALTVLEKTGEKRRTDLLWLCKCNCGNTVTVPATLLLQGKTRSCGCLKRETIHAVNQYVGGTNLRQTLKDDPKSTRAVSGYVGVTPKRGKWQAYITYQGVRHSLGCYDNLPDAVKARARAKEQVMEAALAFAER